MTHYTESWVDHQSNGDSVLVHPETGRPLTEDVGLFFSDADKRNLEVLGSVPMSLEIAYGAHTKASDLNLEDDPKWFEKRLASGSISGYFYEGIGVAPWSAMRMRLDGLTLRAIPWSQGFEERRNRALGLSRAYSSPVDIRKWTPGINQTALALSRTEGEALKQSSAGEKTSPEDDKEGLITFLVAQYVREAAIISNLGRLMARVDKRVVKVGDEHDVLMTFGVSHQALLQKLPTHGVIPKAVFLDRAAYNDTPGSRWLNKELPVILLSGKITAEQYASLNEIDKPEG